MCARRWRDSVACYLRRPCRILQSSCKAVFQTIAKIKRYGVRQKSEVRKSEMTSFGGSYFEGGFDFRFCVFWLSFCGYLLFGLLLYLLLSKLAL